MVSQGNLLRQSFGHGEFLTFGADVSDQVGVCNFAAFGDLILVDKEDGTSAGYAIAFRAEFPNSVGKKSTPGPVVSNHSNLQKHCYLP